MAVQPFDNRHGVIWMNGEYVPWADAKVHVLTHGLHYASAVFEGERAYGGVIFKLDEHTQRLHEFGAASRLRDPLVGRGDQRGLPGPARPPGSCRRLCPADRLARQRDDGRLGAEQSKINLAIAVWEWPSYFKPEEKLKGIRLDLAQVSPARPDDGAVASRRRPAST